MIFFGWERKTSVAFSKLRINTHQWKKNLSSVIAFIPPRLKEYQDKDWIGTMGDTVPKYPKYCPDCFKNNGQKR